MSSRPILIAIMALQVAAAVAEPDPLAGKASPLRRPTAPSPRNSDDASGHTARRASKLALPPLPEGVEEFKFADFFRLPVGPRGLEMTDRLRSLDGQRVRILGFMVKEDLTPCNSCPVPARTGKRPRPAWMEFVVPGRMMLTPLPAMVSHAHYGLADDLPPQTLFVTVPDKFGELVPYTRGPMLLTGVLSVGNKPEPDGRISVVRLTLDPPPATVSTTSQSSLSTTNSAVNPTTK